MRRAAIEAAIARLDAIDGSDPERAHSEADDVLMFYADAEIVDAYRRAVARCDWWASA
jgi:hypothetical protein